MKIFIWEGVLTDYTDGMAVAYAETLEEALLELDKKQNYPDFHMSRELGEPTTIIDCDNDKTPQSFFVYGGG